MQLYHRYVFLIRHLLVCSKRSDSLCQSPVILLQLQKLLIFWTGFQQAGFLLPKILVLLSLVESLYGKHSGLDLKALQSTIVLLLRRPHLIILVDLTHLRFLT